MYPGDDASTVLAGTGVKAGEPSALCSRCVASAKYQAETGELQVVSPARGLGVAQPLGVVAQLGIVVQAAPGADAVAAPAARQVARIRRLRPTEQHRVVAGLKADEGIDPAVRLAVPLDLHVRRRQAGRGSGKAGHVERAHAG